MPNLDRRSFLRATAATGAVAAIGWPAISSPASAAGSSYQALWSDLLRQNSGINVHLNFPTSVYKNHAAVTDLVKRAGVGHVRDGLGLNATAQQQDFKSLAASGVRVLSIVAYGDLTVTRADIDARMAKAADLGGAAVFVGFEGPNEPNSNGGANWLAKTETIMGWIRDSRNAHGMSNVPILSPSLHDRKAIQDGDYGKVANSRIPSMCDYAAFHCYPPPGASPFPYIDGGAARVQTAYPGKPLWMTETGYRTEQIPPDAQATYLVRAQVAAFARRIRVTQYELLDAPSGSPGWGLESCASMDPATWTDKPSLGNITALMRACADPGPAYSPAPLAATIVKPSDVQQLVLGKRDGSHLLLFWRDVTIYNYPKKQRVDPGTRTVKVTTATGTRTLAVGGSLAVLTV